MKTHTQDYKDQLVNLGREIDSKITFTIGNNVTELDSELLCSVNPHFEGAILKSVMKQLDFVSYTQVPIGTEVNYQFGLKVNGSYEYVNYGNYIVEKSEKQEDTNTFKTTCYDKMLYAMKDYEELNVTYPCTIRDFTNALCTKIGLTFANSNDTFTNYDQTIATDLFKDLGYTYRDVLDQLAEVTASTICINKDDELEIRYITEAIINE